MKRNEILLIIAIAIMSGIAVYLISDSMFNANSHSAKVEIIDPISSNVSVSDDSILIDPNRTNISQSPTLNQQINNNPFKAQ